MILKRLAAFVAATISLGQPAAADETAALAAALAAAKAGDWATALSAAEGAQPEGRDVIIWQWLRAEQGKLGDYESFLARRADWPGLPYLKEKGEVAVARSTEGGRVLAYFGADKPRTGKGALAQVKALLAAGRGPEAEDEAARAWAMLKFDAADQDEMLALMGPVLTTVHELRMDRILWDGERVAEAERMLPLLSEGWQALARARLGLRADKDGVQALIAAVPETLAGDAGLAYERFLFRMRADDYPAAAELILSRSVSVASLGDPEAWAERRATLARWYLRKGDPAVGYRIAASHQLTEGEALFDLEFLAGFLALRKLDDPATALRHFDHLKSKVETPISLSRANYWRGRAYEALGQGAEATAAYQSAARHQTAFYGLLAAEKLGLSFDEALLPDGLPGGDWRAEPWAGSSVLAAAFQMSAAGERILAKRFFLHLGESLDDRQLGLLARAAFDIGEPHIALLVGKAAAERGVIYPGAYFPVPEMIPSDLPVSRALALSITRRESEFDTKALSSAGAMGLMQMMPATAEATARTLGVELETDWLTTRPDLNVTLGSAHLRELADEFGPSIPLIAAGYNAGPRRPRQWLEEIGDLRTGAVDPVDWVETVPFTETRTYIMRVTESVVVYRARLKGAAGPVDVTGELTGQ